MMAASHSTELVSARQAFPFTPDEMETVLASRLAASSIAMYQRDVLAYRAYAEQEAFDPLNPQTLMQWRDSLVIGSDMSPNTINRMLSAVRRLMREAAKRDRIAEAIEAKFARVEGVTQKALKSRLKQHGRTRIEPEDMRRLCSAPNKETPVGKRDAALLATLASSGIRASEAASLTTGQIIKRGRFSFLQVKGKTDTSYRDAHLSQEAHNLIKDWLAARPVMSAYVFTNFEGRGSARATDKPMSEAAVWQTVKKYAEQCGLEHIKPHDFRRFVGTQLAAKDIRVAQNALGHKSIEVTAKHYVLDKLQGGVTDNLY